MTKLRTLCKIAKSQNKQLLGNSDFLTQFNFMSDYLSNFSRYDRRIALNQGFLSPVWNDEDEDSDEAILNQFREDVDNLILVKSDSLARMYAALTAEYNPIENYNREEATENAHTGSDEELVFNGQYTETMNKGEQNDEDSFGAKNVTNTQGEQNNSANFGEIINTSGAQSNNITNQVAAFNSNNYEDNEKTSESIGEKIDKISAHNDSNKIGARTDKVSEEARKDNHKSGARVDSVVHSSKDDTITTSYASSNKITSKVHGNIGVTTNQDMIIAELELRKSNFFDYLLSMIVKEICTYSEL